MKKLKTIFIVIVLSLLFSFNVTADGNSGGQTSTEQGNMPAPPPGGMPGGGGGTVDHGSYAFLVQKDISGGTYESSGDQENALRAEGDVTVSLSNIEVDKVGGAAGSGDSSNFYGSNAGILALDGAGLSITDSSVNTGAEGSNGIFSYGSGTVVNVKNTTVRTSENSSGGIMVAGGGTMHVVTSDIETMGNSSAALRTDRGGGILTVEGGKYVSHGSGSPAIYSTADVTVSDAQLTATSSEAIVVEGKNSVELNNCTVSGNMVKGNGENFQNVMIYQSMSGDADTGEGSFVMTGGSLTSHNSDMFYTTNTHSSIELDNVDLTLANGVLLRAVGNDARNGWGTVGQNGAKCEFTAVNQKLSGEIIVDDISSLTLDLSKGTDYEGVINGDNQGGDIAVSIDDNSRWTLTGDSYISSFSGNVNNVDANGFTLYVGGKALK